MRGAVAHPVRRKVLSRPGQTCECPASLVSYPYAPGGSLWCGIDGAKCRAMAVDALVDSPTGYAGQAAVAAARGQSEDHATAVTRAELARVQREVFAARAAPVRPAQAMAGSSQPRHPRQDRPGVAATLRQVFTQPRGLAVKPVQQRQLQPVMLVDPAASGSGRSVEPRGTHWCVYARLCGLAKKCLGGLLA